ncbi:hypothetical protein [Bradyrhizobium sp. Ec3.3]|uniref:hypothetical protein n=1 Tax=Bradyrhizobium sp. Ec3.3 TaxID=189753 RepID=UPI00040E4434|nr:hypothetical protein [Bradyrhizobium sp. Ec3.3]
MEFQVFGVSFAGDQLARAVAGSEANREQNKYDKKPYHQLNALSRFCPKASLLSSISCN